MSYRSLWFAGGIALVQLAAVPAAGQHPVRLAEVYQALPGASPRMAAADALTAAVEARIAPSRRPPDPELQFGLMNRELPGLGYADPLGMTQVQLMQMIPTAGKLGSAGTAAAERAVAQRARASEIGWEVRARSAMAFYELFRTERSIVVARETSRLLQDLAKVAETMYGVGEGRQADVLRAQVEVARMEEEILRLEAERATALAGLNAQLARAPDASIGDPLFPVLPDTLPPLDSLIADAIEVRPMLRAGQAEVRAADAVARGARREIWPDLQVGVQYGQRPMPGGGTDRMASLMLGVTLPVFAGSRQFAMRRETEAMQAMARAELDEMRATTRGRVGELYVAVQRARRLGQLYRTTILPQAETAARSALVSYRVGGVDFMTLVDDRMTVNRYRMELIALDAERGSSLAELEMLLGRELFDPATARAEEP